MLSHFAFRKRARTSDGPSATACKQTLADEDDILCPESLTLEDDDDVQSIKTMASDKTARTELAAPALRFAHQDACQVVVPATANVMAIAQFVDKATTMRPRDVHSPLDAKVDGYVTMIGVTEHCFKLVCPLCHQTRAFKRSKDAGADNDAWCGACKGVFDMTSAEEDLFFPIALGDSTGELCGIRMHGKVALRMAAGERRASVLKRRLLFSRWHWELRATWSERLKQPIVEILDFANWTA